MLALTEHWLRHNELQCIILNDFVLISSYRAYNIVYNCENRFKAFEHSALCNLSVEQCCEISAVQLIDLNLLLVCLYRSNDYTNKDSDFLGVLERALDLVVSTGLELTMIYLVGDANWLKWLAVSSEHNQF